MMSATEQETVFEQHRGVLRGIAYRMTGSLAEAEDIVQDTWLKWRRATGAEVRDARSWLVTACSRQALDTLKSARVRREQYCGVWLPEPFHEADAEDPATLAELDESVSMALMLALEKLSPQERAAFLLHDVFGHDFEEVAAILGKASATCRKLASRARASLQNDRPRFTATAGEHRRLLDAFMRAACSGDLEALKALLAESVEMRSDGGGKVEALPEVMRGADKVSRFLVAVLHDRPAAREGLKLLPCRINGAPGVLIHEFGRLATVLTVAVSEGRIQSVYAVRNPDKISRLANGNFCPA